MRQCITLQRLSAPMISQKVTSLRLPVSRPPASVGAHLQSLAIVVVDSAGVVQGLLEGVEAGRRLPRSCIVDGECGFIGQCQ